MRYFVPGNEILINNDITPDLPQYSADLSTMSIFLLQDLKRLILGELNIFNYNYLYNQVLLYRKS